MNGSISPRSSAIPVILLALATTLWVGCPTMSPTAGPIPPVPHLRRSPGDLARAALLVETAPYLGLKESAFYQGSTPKRG